VIGAGPAGLYAADILAREAPGTQIDVLESLPAPFGLVRYGVAPDHPRIKQIIEALHNILDSGNARFVGNVEFGRDVTLDDLRARYDAVVVATGAIRDVPIDLPGEELPGSFGAADFVAWYDAHPDFPQEWPLDAASVAVIGNGNVALDIVRVLARRPEDMATTDAPDHVLAALKGSQVRDIHVFGRRGPAQAKFSPLELRELGQVPGVQIVTYPDDYAYDAGSRDAMAGNGRLRQVVKTLEGWRDSPQPEGERRIHLHFLSRPERIEGDDHVTGLTIRRTELDGQGGVNDTDEVVTYPVQAVYRAAGYFGSPVEDVPFDARRGVVPNAGGRVLGDDGEPMAGVYATGWIKRGPVGLIGSTKSDAAETIGHIVEDLPSLATAPDRDPLSLDRLLAERGVRVVTWEGWQSVDGEELARGREQGRERVKLPTRGEMTAAAWPESQ
jgi:ferredoxin--NADP+ reductase